ncbi:MAG: PHP domain-containing protein [Lentisphaeria bacterium]|nr:PHP domain-containing protein [Lentisphaeria bacterium]
MAIDLHIHSTASDGTVPPGELPAMAAAAGLSAIALTDHDTTAGLGDFLACQKDFPGVELITGVELSSRIGAREIHIVGLFIDQKNRVLQEYLHAMREERITRARAMQSKLAALGYVVTDEDLAAVGMQEDVPGRPHFAMVLAEKYNFPDTKSVFDQLLKQGGAGFVPRALPPPEEAVKVIKQAGGAAIWAHPFHSRRNENNFIARTIRELKIAGLDGLEAYYSEYTPTKTATALRMAKEYNIVCSGGSDFHGAVHPQTRMGSGRGGLNVPDELLAALKKAVEPKVVLL